MRTKRFTITVGQCEYAGYRQASRSSGGWTQTVYLDDEHYEYDGHIYERLDDPVMMLGARMILTELVTRYGHKAHPKIVNNQE